MGMDLVACNPDAKDGRYNWAGWEYLFELLDGWDVDLSEFSGFNDGDLISEETCKKVADAIEEHLNELELDDRIWLEPHIELWRNCGGYEQC